MNLANRLTIARILIIPVFMALILSNIQYGDWLAAALFSVAAMTDGLDGYIARSRQQVTNFGKFLDPVADKLLISAALISLVDIGSLSAWIAMIIIGREIAVLGLRILAMGEGEIVSSSLTGKLKTVFQVFAIVAWILRAEMPPVGLMTIIVDYTAILLMGIAIVLTIVSGLDYYFKSKGILEKIST